ncbi:MAG: hypothetical protein M3297_00310 [Thermoproteota archaeon]|nr:hypothetical protein [Thermoproteota archaeon]
MSSLGISLGLFTTLLLASILPLSIGNDYLSSTQGIVLFFQGGSSLQTAHSQEQDEETGRIEDENEEESQPDNDENSEEGDEEEDSGQTEFTGICCSWDERLSDGVLMYRIIERVDEDNEEEEVDDDNQDEEEFSIDDLSISDSDQRRAVTDVVNEWNTRIPNLRLVNEDSNVDTDIEVQLVDELGGMAAGATLLRFDEDGFINKATI